LPEHIGKCIEKIRRFSADDPSSGVLADESCLAARGLV